MSALVREFDWHRTLMGPMESCADELRFAVDICFGSRFPMFVWLGRN